VNATAARPQISVVMATHDRPERLRRALAALRAQTIDADRYELVVVDDGSGAETVTVLEAERATSDGPALRVLRQAPSQGPAAARNLGWQAASAALIAFTDDDCEVTPAWLETLLEVSGAHPGAIVQGPTTANPAESDRYGPFSHTLENHTLGRGYETANILYPRALLERLGGFDSEAFSRAGGEDTDLAWRAIEQGVEPAWAPGALVHHAVTNPGPIGKLRAATRWTESMLAYRRHAGLRRTRYAIVFWNRHHFEVVRAGAALIVPRRYWWLRWWLAAPYLSHLVQRRSGPLLAPYLILYDALEVASVVRGSLRYRVLVI
jgi:glycosyltransferase involved in cell wall biosynthesis